MELESLLSGEADANDCFLEVNAGAGGHGVDEFYVRGLSVSSPATTLDSGHLSDHAPVAITLAY